MNPKKKSRCYRASVSIQALDLAISRFIHSLGYTNPSPPTTPDAAVLRWFFLLTTPSLVVFSSFSIFDTGSLEFSGLDDRSKVYIVETS